MKKNELMKIYSVIVLGMLTLASCGSNGATVGLNAINLRAIENTCPTLSDGKKYLALSFNYSGTLDMLKFSFTPYVNLGTPPTQFVKIEDVNNPPSYAKVLLNESSVVKVYVSLENATLSSATLLSSNAVTAPDPKQTRPMSIKLEVSNKLNQSSMLELKETDVSGCYTSNIVPIN